MQLWEKKEGGIEKMLLKISDSFDRIVETRIKRRPAVTQGKDSSER